MPKATVRVPAALRTFVGGASELVLEGSTVGEVIRALSAANPALHPHLFTSGGRLRRPITVYLNEHDIRSLDREATRLREGDVVSVVWAGAEADPISRSKPARRPSRSKAPAEEPFPRDELSRYSRHLLLPEVGLVGQRKLRKAKVLVAGMGGLGTPVALYLAAAGVGELGLVDFDTVDLSNLQRQVLYTTSDVGRPKVAAAKERIEALNPGTRVVAYPTRLTSENAFDILRPFDVIVDGTDNFPTRYLLNDAAVLLGKPCVYGSVYRFEGQLSVFDARRGPCYRCLFTEPPSPDLAPSCAEAGVLGVLPGLIGLMQATETVKLVLERGNPMVGRLLLFDALRLEFREVTVGKNPRCVLCSSHATQKGLIDYPSFCGVPAPGAEPFEGTVPEVEADLLAAELASAKPPFLVDVREPFEWEIAHLPRAHLIPKGQVADRVDELTHAAKLVLYCRTGIRSAESARLLLELGFRNVRTLRGGIHAWAQRVDPSIPLY
jgi:adenylyltransferase/sulfurtransferase